MVRIEFIAWAARLLQSSATVVLVSVVGFSVVLLGRIGHSVRD